MKMELEMKQGYWVACWVAFGVLAALPISFVFSVFFFAILISMRVAQNQMSQHIWIALWLSLARAGPTLDMAIDLQAHGVLTFASTVIRLFITSDYEMPTSAFWVLLLLLLQFNRKPSVGAVVYWNVLIFNLHLKFDGIHLPGLLISWYFIQALVAIFLVAVNAFLYPKYIPTVFLWFALVGILHNQMWPFNKDFGLLWIGAWWLSFHAILFAFAPDMPVLWYAMWVSIVLGVGFGLRPDESLGGFVLWTLTIILMRMILFYLYVAYFLNTNRDDLFPFNLFSREWSLSGRRWYPLNSRKHDSINSERLCERCDEMTTKSRIILGSSFFFKRMVEWHGFYTREEFVSLFNKKDVAGQSASERTATLPEPSCRLCCLLWYSMSPRRQRAVEVTLRDDSTRNVNCDDDSSLAAPKTHDAELRVKVWEERPSSLYSYMQLFWGDIAVGARLLIHSNEPSETRQFFPSLSSPCRGRKVL